MFQDQPSSETDYRRFIEQVRESGEVWGLQSDEGSAYCASNEYEDADVLLFWSDRAQAQQHAQGEWKNHKPTAIPLDEFVENWLQGMDEDGVLVGLNWDGNLSGIEIDAGELAEELAGDEGE